MGFTKTCDGVPQSVIEHAQGGDCNAARNAPVKRPGDPSRNARQRIGVTPQRNGQPDCVFVVLGIEKCCNRFGDGSLAGLVERVSWPDARDSSTEIVTELLFYRSSDFLFGFTLSCKEYCCCRGLGTANAFGVVVGDVSTRFRFLEHLFECLESESDRAHSHGGSIAPAVVGQARSRLYPMRKSDAITPVGIGPGVLMEIVNVGSTRQQRIGDRYGKNGVIGESAFGDKEREICALLCLELMYRADNVACDGADHMYIVPRCVRIAARDFGSGSAAGSSPRIVHGLSRLSFFFRDPVNFFLQHFLGEADALQHALAMLDHLRVAAQIAD